MTKKRKIIVSLFVVLPVLFISYLAFNGWHLLPQPFVTYGGKGTPSDTADAGTQYRKYCAGCHGSDLNTFANQQWKFGKTRSAVFKAIKYGYPNTGMPAFEVTFTDKQTLELSDYLLNSVVKPGLNKNTVNKTTSVMKSDLQAISIDTIAAIGEVPWCVTFLPNKDWLVTERNGQLYRITTGRQVQKISGVPAVVAKGQGGLLDVILHPGFSSNQIIYLSYSKPENGSDKSTTAILQAKLDGNTLKEQHDIFVAKPYSSTRHHYGGRMVFDKNGLLFFSVGDRGNEKQNPQNIENDLGKIHRVKDDGSTPADNPFTANKKASASIFCYGNRNPQGLTVHPVTGAVWENEHGPMGGDEINVIEPGKNYGWPVITYGINYNGTAITDKTAMPGMEQPLHFWVPSIAPSGLALVQGDKYKGWEGNLLSGSLKFNWISRCTIEGNAVVAEESMLKEIGRIRDVKMGPDGYIYITVESPGYLLRLVPVE